MTAIQDYRDKPQEVKTFPQITIVDLDSVLCRTLTVILCYANERFDKSLTVDDVTEWDLWKVYGVSKTDWKAWWDQYPLQKAIYEQVEPIANAEWLFQFVKANNVRLLTGRSPLYYPQTKTFLSGNHAFSKIWNTKHLGDKSKLKYAKEEGWTPERVRCVIEDSPTTALEFAEAGYRVLLFDYAYNRHIEHPNITRVGGWAEACEVMEGVGCRG